MLFKKHKTAEEEGIDAWLMTYADMITLLLCFFVIMLSVSEPKKDRLEKLREGIMTQFQSLQMETPFLGVTDNLRIMIEQKQLDRALSVQETEQGFALEMSSAALFMNGSAEFREGAEPLLDQIITTVQQAGTQDYLVEIEGHTDDVPINTVAFPSNWELSSARAAHVARVMIEKGIPATQLKISGFADTQPKAPNRDAGGQAIAANQELNRRVVLQMRKKENVAAAQ